MRWIQAYRASDRVGPTAEQEVVPNGAIALVASVGSAQGLCWQAADCDANLRA